MTNILLTAFKNTSAEYLIREMKVGRSIYLPNDKVKDSEILIDAMSKESFDLVISFGQRPNIKNKVYIETTAKKGLSSIDTAFDCEKMKHSFENAGIITKISNNAGTSYCNELYYNGLRYIEENRLKTKIVFVHVPFMKNIYECENFRLKLHEVIGNMGM